MLRTFVQVAGVTLTLIASFFLLWASAGLKTEDVAQLAKLKFGYSLAVAQNLVEQQTNARTGLAFLLLAFAAQLANTLWPLSIGDFSVHIGGAVSVVMVSIALGVMAWFLSRRKIERRMQKVKATLEAPR